MKSVLVLFLLFLCSCAAVHSDIANTAIDSKYEAALAYLDKDMQDKPFHVVDTLVYISQIYWFDKKPASVDGVDYVLNLERLDSIHGFKNEYYSFNRRNKSGIYNAYFSKPIDNYLDVELFNNRGRIKRSYNYLSSFNTSFIYRFTFDENNKVTNVDRIKMIYD